MKKVKGIVLESTKKKLILLTCEGEYRSLPARGKLYPPGAEVEIAPAMLPANLPVFAAAAAVLLVMAFTLLWHTAVTRPAAYLALDINPSILLLLDSDASVISTEALNNEGEILGKELELKGELAVTALELILQEAGSRGYLAGERDNMVLLALAAPSDYVLGDALLRQSASQQLLSLKVDSYLKISTTTPEAAQEAMQKEVSLNAVLLAEELAVKGLLPLQDKNDEDEQEKTAAAKAEINVQKLLEQVLPQHVFTEKEFVRGDVSGRPGPPVTPPGQDKKPGPPDFTPPGQDKESGRPDFVPPGQDEENGPPVTPPGQDKKTGPPVTPPGQDKKPDTPEVTPPGKDKEPGGNDFVPPGQDKKQGPPFIPPGQDKKPGPPVTPPGQDKEQKAPVAPPVQDKKTGSPVTPSGQDKIPNTPDPVPPGQGKDPERPDSVPPGQEKEPGPPVTPPGQDKKPMN